jgi:hypothetical protein
VKTRKIAPGLTYIRIVRRQLPLRTFVLRIDLSKAITLDTTIAEDALPSRRQLSRIVRNHGALAGVNGDPGEGLGNTVHPFAQDGDLLHTAGPDAEMFAISKDESSTFLGNPKLKVNVTDMSNGRVFTLDRWNRRAPEPGEIVGFSPLGGTLASPPSVLVLGSPCAAGTPQVAAPDGVDRDYVVDAATVPSRPSTATGVSCSRPRPGPTRRSSSSPSPPERPCVCTGPWAGRACSTRSAAIRSCSSTALAPRVRLVRPSAPNRDRRHGHRQDPAGRDRRPPAPVVAGRDAGRAQKHPEGPRAPSTR